MTPQDDGLVSQPGEASGLSAALGGTGAGFRQAPAIVTAKSYDNQARLREVFAQDKRECLDARWIFERAWWRNLLYTLGRHWIYYDRRRGQWLDKRMARWMPRPTTNKCAEVVEAITAVFASISLSTLARPIGGDPRNVAAAEVADKLQPYLHAEHQMDQVLRDMDWWLVVTGNVFLHTYWDHAASHGQIVIPYEQCLDCQGVFSPQQITGPLPHCPACGGVRFRRDVRDPSGDLVGERITIGKGRTVALSPFEIGIPPIYTDAESSPKLLRMAWRPRSYFEERYPDLARKLTWQKSPSERSVQLLRTMATQADMSAAPLGGMGAGQELEEEGQTEYELYRKPSKEFSDGLYMRVIGDGDEAIVVHGEGDDRPGPLPYQTRDGRPIIPIVHVGYHPIAGRLWARGPLDLVVQKNDQLNQLDALIQLIVTRVANPVWLEPKGAEVKSFTGEPGLVLRWNSLASGNAKPERIPGENVPESLFRLRQQYLDDIEQLAGTFDILKGARPAGVEAFSALQLLVERSQSRLATVFAERGEAYRKWYAVAIELERAYGPTRRVQAVLSPNGGWTVRHFETAQLDGAVEIVVEDGSQAPKTNLGRRAAIEHASTLGLIDRTDPEQRYTILTDLGLTDLIKTLDFDVKSALQEQDRFEQWASKLTADLLQNLAVAWAQYQQQLAAAQQIAQQAQQVSAALGVPPVLPPLPTAPEMTPFVLKAYHSDSVHYAEHRRWANSDRAREVFDQFPIAEQFFNAHLDAHRQRQLAMTTAPAPPVVQSGGAMERSNTESGNVADIPRGQRQTAQGRGPE